MPRQAKLRKKNGHWYTAAKGGRYFGKVGEVSYADAEQAFREFLANAGPTEAHPLQTAEAGRPCTVQEVCDIHLDWVKSHRADATYKQRQWALNLFCQYRPANSPKVGRIPWDRVGQSIFEGFTAYVVKTLSDASAWDCQKAIKACWRHSAEHEGGPLPRGYKPFYGGGMIRLTKKVPTESALLTEAEHKALLKHANKAGFEGFGDLLKAYYHTGARTSELLHAKVQDFQPRNHQIVLREWKAATVTGRVRVITLNAQATKLFQKCCKGKRLDANVFSAPDANELDKDYVAKRFRKVRDKAGVRKGITIYSYRHLWISELLMAGQTGDTVARLAGTSVRMLEQTYGHFRSAHLQQAVSALDEYRSKAG